MSSDEPGIDVGDGLGTRLQEAIRSLGADRSDSKLLRHRSGAAAVVRVGGAVVKAFEVSHREQFERERTALRALSSTGLVPNLVGAGDLWIATEWCDLEPPERTDAEATIVDRWLGEALAVLHRVHPGDLAPLPLAPRLNRWLAGADDEVVPKALQRDIDAKILPLVELLQARHFVHGDWGSSNVLVQRERPTGIDKIVDLEDARRGDPAEDFKWPLVEGPPWDAYRRMADAYAAAGGSLGPNGAERLVVAATDWALDVLTWYPLQRSPFAAGPLATLTAVTSGQWPVPP